MKIYNFGSLNIDYVYAVDHFVVAGETLAAEKMSIFPGGKGLNQSIALARAGAKVIHGAVLGKDGGFLMEKLSAAGVDVSRIEQTDGSCGHAIIQVNKSGQNSILLFPGANHRVDKDYAKRFLYDARPDDILLLQNETNELDSFFEVACKKKMQIVFNPSPFHPDIRNLPLSHVKWWFCNEIEGKALFGGGSPQQIVSNFSAKFPSAYLILTLGADGSIFKSADTLIHQPIYKAQTVDTTAAGDTFTGYFIAAVTKGKDVRFALDIASKAASIAVSRKGASESIPYMDEIHCDAAFCLKDGGEL